MLPWRTPRSAPLRMMQKLVTGTKSVVCIALCRKRRQNVGAGSPTYRIVIEVVCQRFFVSAKA